MASEVDQQIFEIDYYLAPVWRGNDNLKNQLPKKGHFLSFLFHFFFRRQLVLMSCHIFLLFQLDTTYVKT